MLTVVGSALVAEVTSVCKFIADSAFVGGECACFGISGIRSEFEEPQSCFDGAAVVADAEESVCCCWELA